MAHMLFLRSSSINAKYRLYLAINIALQEYLQFPFDTSYKLIFSSRYHNPANVTVPFCAISRLDQFSLFVLRSTTWESIVMTTFDGQIREYPTIVVDRFTLRAGIKYFFLTHCHSG